MLRINVYICAVASVLIASTNNVYAKEGNNTTVLTCRGRWVMYSPQHLNPDVSIFHDSIGVVISRNQAKVSGADVFTHQYEITKRSNKGAKFEYTRDDGIKLKGSINRNSGKLYISKPVEDGIGQYVTANCKKSKQLF